MAKEETTPSESEWLVMEILGFTVDEFVDSYFSGNRTNAVAALLQNLALTEEQIEELEEILEKSKAQKQE